jgi:hypothetical protein
MKQLATAIIGLPITLPILAYLGFCAAMAQIKGEFAKRYQLPPLPPSSAR